VIGSVSTSALATSVAVVAVMLATQSAENAAAGSNRPEPSVNAAAVSKVDYVIDLDSGMMMPLSKAIIGSVAKSTNNHVDPSYAASPNGSRLAYVGTGDDGRRQIFVARLDGTGVRQMTHDPRGASSPAWSPDRRKIVYEGYRSSGVRSLFVLDVASRASKPIIDKSRRRVGIVPWANPQFTPDGLSLLYTGNTERGPVLQIVPVAGGKSRILIGPRGNLADASLGAISPDVRS
jgi:Tol biopolymer transport system component